MYEQSVNGASSPHPAGRHAGRLASALLAAALALCLLPRAALAGPAYPGVQKVTDGTGGALSVQQHGDEHFSYITDTEGNLLYRDDGGYYRYIVSEGNAFALGDRVFQETPWYQKLLPEAFRRNRQDERPRVNTKSAGEDFQKKLEALYAATGAGAGATAYNRKNFTYDEHSKLENYVPVSGVDPLFGKLVPEGQGFSEPPIPTRGSVCPLLIIKLQYTDTKCLFSDAQWYDRFFGNRGVARYYNEVSDNRFTYVPAKESAGVSDDGVVTVTLPINQPRFDLNYCGHNFGQGARADVYQAPDGRKYAIYGNASLYAYGLEAAGAYIDFSLYDRQKDGYYNGNGDGYVSPTELAVLVVNAGYEASYGLSGRGDPTTWASSWYMNTWWKPSLHNDDIYGERYGIRLNGVQLYKFTIIGENLSGTPAYGGKRQYDYTKTPEQNRAEGNIPYQAEIGTSCHELGHDLGLRDLYNTTPAVAQTKAVEALSLMGSGSWGQAKEDYPDRPGSSPSHLDAYSKIWLGFYQADTVSASGVYPVTEASDSGNYNILRVNTDQPDVYYLVENRTFTGFDKGLYHAFGPPDGVVYWRIDEDVIRKRYAINRVNTVPGHYGIMPEYIHYDLYDDYLRFPFRSRESNDYCVSLGYSDQRTFLLPEKRKVSLTSNDPSGARMDVLLNASTPIELTLRPGNSFFEGKAGDITAVLGAGSNLTLNDLLDVRMNGGLLSSPEQYEARSGSIIVTLKAAYLNTLAPGAHTLRLTLKDGTVAEAQILVCVAEIPKAGDSAMPWLWAGLMTLSAAGLALRRRRRRGA